MSYTLDAADFNYGTLDASQFNYDVRKPSSTAVPSKQQSCRTSEDFSLDGCVFNVSSSAPSQVPAVGVRATQRRSRQEPESNSFSDTSDDDAEDEVSIVERKKRAALLTSLRRRDDYIRDVLKLTGPEHATQRLAFKSILPSGFCQYISHWNKLISFSQGRRLPFPAISLLTLCEWMAHGDPKCSNGTIDAMHSAVNFYRRCTNQATEEEFCAAVKAGFQMAQIGASQGVRGAITRDMVLQILDLPDAVVPRPYKDWFILLSATGMRINQLMTLRLSWCTRKTVKGNSFYHVVPLRNHKGCKGTRGRQSASESNYSNPDWTAELDRIFADVRSRRSTQNADPVVGFGLSEALALQYIRAASKILKWDQALNWVVHGLRHGAATDAFFRYGDAEYVNRLLDVQKSTGHTTYAMLCHYSRSNEDRLLLAAAKKQNDMARRGGIHKCVQRHEARFVRCGRKVTKFVGPEEASNRKKYNTKTKRISLTKAAASERKKKAKTGLKVVLGRKKKTTKK